MNIRIIYRRLIRQLVSVMALWVMFGVVHPVYAKYIGASLELPACDPGANPNTDVNRINPVDGGYHYTQSCINHYDASGKPGGNPITMDNFAIKIRFDPETASAMQGLSLAGAVTVAAPMAAPVGAMAGAGIALCGMTMGVQHLWIEVGKNRGVCTTVFKVVREGDMACVYAMPMGMFNFAVTDREETAPKDGAEPHCFMLPPPRRELQPPSFGSIISPACTRFCQEYDDDNNPNTAKRRACASRAPDPFLGVVVQCVSETMDNIFVAEVDDEHHTIFSAMQLHLKQIIGGLLTLYVMFVAYQFLMRKAKVERQEFIWYFLRYGLVLYFSVFSGLLVVKPMLLDFSQSVSLMLLQAGFGTKADYNKAKDATEMARMDFDSAQDRLLQARKAFAVSQREVDKSKQNLQLLTNCLNYQPSMVQCPSDVITEVDKLTGTNKTPANIKAIINAKLDAANATFVDNQKTADAKSSMLTSEDSNYASKVDAYNKAVFYEGSFGYNLCDFDNVHYGDNDTTDLRTQWLPNGSTIVRDMGYLRLWDMVDCRFMKYLGVGDYEGNAHTPKVLLIAIAMLFSNALGIMIFILTLIFFVFVILLIFRIAHMYLMAVIALNILIYVGPLFIPAALFESRKSIFAEWIKQVIACTMQPIILFAFLAFLFGSFDQIIYGNNHVFYAMDYGDEYAKDPSGQPDAREIAKVAKRNQIVKLYNKDYPEDESKAKCPDEKTMGCIYQSGSLKFVRTPDFGFGADFTFMMLSKGISTNDGVIIFLSMIKLFFIAYLMHSVLGIFENISATLTNAMGQGVKALSAAPSPSLSGAASMLGNTAKQGGNLAAKGIGALAGKKQRSGGKT